MANKITPIVVNTPLNSSSFQQQINENFEAIQESLDKQLQREAEAGIDNEMEQDLDMNSHRVINLAAPINPSDAARKQDIDDAEEYMIRAEAAAEAAEESAGNAAESERKAEGYADTCESYGPALQIVEDNLTDIQNAGANAQAAHDYSDLAKDWATKMDGMVSGEDYSSKYYADQAAQSAVSIRRTYRGVYDAAANYLQGDIVKSTNSSKFYEAIVDNTNVPLNTTNTWSMISNDQTVQFSERSDNQEYPLGLVNPDAHGTGYAGPVNFVLTDAPKLNASTGTLSTPKLITTTQNQGDNSTKAATTAYVDTGLGTKQNTLNASQQNAVNSGITAAKVSTYDGYASNKQDKLNTNQLNAVNSGITSAKVNTYDGYAAGKQNTLVSGTNIKTINNQSVLGGGNLDIDGLPTQTGQSGKYLTTNGTNASWANVPNEIPSQAGQSGKYLTTDGTTTSWATVSSGNLPDPTGHDGEFLSTDGEGTFWAEVPSGGSNIIWRTF